MVESGLLAGQLAGSALQQGPQSLPTNAQTADVQRFQDLIGSSNSDMSVQSQSMDNSVLQIVEPGQAVDSGSLMDKMINQASKIDGNYHSLLDQLSNRTGFDEYLNKQQDVESNEMLTYPSVSNGELDSNPLDAALESIENSNSATLAYQEDLNNWATQFRIWTSGVEIISAAAQKVSSAFQTLFRASG